MFSSGPLCAVVVFLGIAGCTGVEPDRVAPGGQPLEVVSTGGRSFARIGPLGEGPIEGTWTRLTPRTGAWVGRSWHASEVPRPFTVVSPDGACFGKVIGVLDLAREIGVRAGRIAETSEPWIAAEIAGCPSFEGDRRMGLDGRVSDAKWLGREPGDALPDDPLDADLRTIGVLRTGAREFRIVEEPEGELSAIVAEPD